MSCLKDCNNCVLRKNLPDFASPMTGNFVKNTDLMLVFESPIISNIILNDYNFTLSQKYIFDLLHSNNVTEYYMTMAIKCCTEKPPTKKQITTCKSWITEEIELFRPKRIITFGRIAATSVLNNHSLVMSDIKNKIHEQENKKILTCLGINQIFQAGTKETQALITSINKLKNEQI